MKRILFILLVLTLLLAPARAALSSACGALQYVSPTGVVGAWLWALCSLEYAQIPDDDPGGTAGGQEW